MNKEGRPFPSLVGKVFGRLTVLELASRRPVRWRCRCDCGNISVCTSTNIKKTASCGCLKREISKQIHSKPPGENMRNCILRRYKASARKRELSWELSDADFYQLAKRDCHYCGASPRPIIYKNQATTAWVCNGVDRMHNEIGYTRDNCVACCDNCNFAKRNLTYADFIHWIDRLVEYHKGK